MKSLILKYSRFSILIGFSLGIFLLNFFLLDRKSEIRFEELALGKETTTVWANFNSERVHCGDLGDIDTCLKSYNTSGSKPPVVLWFGNSQLHAINQYRLGDESAAFHLHKYLKDYGLYALTLSQANANLQEHYLLLAYLLDKIQIKKLILPIFFDDLREDKLRPKIKSILKDKASFEIISESLTGKSLISRFIDKDVVGNISKVKDKNEQDNFENLLDKGMSKIWPLWNERNLLRGTLFNKVYQLRNSIFRINASTTRKMIPGRYFKNLNAYQEILNLAKANNIEVLVYIPPIRSDIKIPYNLEKYDSFKKEVRDIAKKNNVHFFSLENLVPSEFWGKKASTNLKKEAEVDFMHFQANGHHLLAEAILLELNKISQNKKKNDF